MAKSSKVDASEKVDRTVGVIVRDESFFLVASRSLGMAFRFLPILHRMIMGMAAVSMLSMVVSVVSIYRRPNPQVLLTFPDGSTRCAKLPLDPETKQPIPRPAAAEAVCERLSSSPLDVSRVVSAPADGGAQ